ncbi:MAG: hypothetical protein OJF51_004859 [Nitrospira sp.]|nr:MAG: hypothetical protein OJF51_004859 [Nitrospira sp.]
MAVSPFITMGQVWDRPLKICVYLTIYGRESDTESGAYLGSIGFVEDFGV